MSYDIWLEVDGEELFDWNYTSNMAGAWREAGVDFMTWPGRKCSNVVDELRNAIVVMIENFETYEQRFNAPNGWGEMRTLVPHLIKLWMEMLKSPDSEIQVSW